MITACKDYITDCGKITIWEIPFEVFKKKCEDCSQLNTEYQKCFLNVKQKIDKNKDEKQFDFSETYIFGKINSFVLRLEKILELMNVIKTWRSLEKSCIEGIEMLNSKLQFIATTMKKKMYDYLDYRKSEFDTDYEEFKGSINELEVCGCVCVEFFFKTITFKIASLPCCHASKLPKKLALFLLRDERTVVCISNCCSFFTQIQVIIFMERTLGKITTMPMSLMMLSRFQW